MDTMHPGEYFAMSHVEPYQIEAAEIAASLGVSPESALRLSLAFERSAESWLNMQNKFDLAQARENVDVPMARPFSFPRKDAA